MSWKNNGIMYWSLDGVSWNMITDHGRSELEVQVERLGSDSRMANGTMRRYTVAKKRSWSTSWENLPAKRGYTYNGKIAITTVDNGWGGEEIESFHNANDGAFWMKIRKGADEAKGISDGTIEVVKVMISSFSKTIVKRGVVDLWNVDLELVEV